MDKTSQVGIFVVLRDKTLSCSKVIERLVFAANLKTQPATSRKYVRILYIVLGESGANFKCVSVVLVFCVYSNYFEHYHC